MAQKDFDYNDIQNGPIPEGNRQCRDIFCCIVFIVFLILAIVFSAIAYNRGDVNRMWRGVDPNSTICGLGAAADFPILYFFNPTTFQNQDLTTRVCANKCPSFDQNGVLSPISCFGNRNCTFTVTILPNGSSSGQISNSSFLGYDSISFLGRICVPSPSVLLGTLSPFQSQFSNQLQAGGIANFTQDITSNWRWLLVGFGFGLVITLIFVTLMRWCIGPLVWLAIVFLVVLFAVIGILFLSNSGQFPLITQTLGRLGFNSSVTPASYYAIYGYVSFGISGLIILLAICCCTRIRLAVAISKVASKFVIDICRVVFVPIFTTLILLGMWAAFLIVIVNLISTVEFVAEPGAIFATINNYGSNPMLQVYFLCFSTLWFNAVISAVTVFVVAATCCMWYYSHGIGAQLDSPIIRSWKMLFRYHFGSIAFGSFILSLLQFIQIIISALRQNSSSAGGCLAQCGLSCIQCILACLQRIFSFVSRSAYIQIALRGKNFCAAAYDAASILLLNPLRYSVVLGLGETLMTLMKFMITALTVFLFYVLVTYVPSIRATLLEPLYYLLIVAIVTFTIASMFMAVFSIAMQAIIACFIIDENIQKQKGQRAPMYAPPQLLQIINT